MEVCAFCNWNSPYIKKKKKEKKKNILCPQNLLLLPVEAFMSVAAERVASCNE